MTTSIQSPASSLRNSEVSEQSLFGVSWSIVLIVGLMPLIETSLYRSPSVTMPTVIAFFAAVSSGVLLCHRYSWVGLVMHIYSQLVIWLSLFVMSLAVLLFAGGYA